MIETISALDAAIEAFAEKVDAAEDVAANRRREASAAALRAARCQQESETARAVADDMKRSLADLRLHRQMVFGAQGNLV